MLKCRAFFPVFATIASIIAACVLSGGAYATPGGGVKEEFVDCADGDDASNIQEEIDQADEPIIITFTGSCTGDLSINQDDITIEGESSDGTDEIVGQVIIQGVQRIQLNNLTITGGASGIIAFDGAALRAQEITVIGTGTNTNSCAVGVLNGSTVILTDVEITGNTGRGVLANANATVEVRGDSAVSDNGADGFGIFKNSSLTLNTVDVKANGSRGINVGDNSAVEIRENSEISGNTRHGINAFGGASVHIGGATILGGPDGGSHAFTATQSRVFITKRNDVAPVIDGGSNGKGLTLAYGASAEISDATINSDGSGLTRALTVLGGSMAIIRGSTITSPNTDETVYIEEASTVEFEDSTISSPNDAAISAVYGGTVRFRSAGAGGSEINNPFGFMAVIVNYGSRLVLEEGYDTFNGNILVANGSVADIKNAKINGNVEIENDAVVRLRNRVDDSTTEVTANIDIRGDSLLEFRESPIGNDILVGGTVTCHDPESSVSNATQASVTGGFITCTGF